MAAAFAEPISHEVIGGLIAGGLTALDKDWFPGPSDTPGVDNSDGGPTLGGECVSGVSGGVWGVVAFGGWPRLLPWLPPPFVTGPDGGPPPGCVDLSIFLYLLRRFWNQILTWK